MVFCRRGSLTLSSLQREMMSSVGYTNAAHIASLRRCGNSRWTRRSGLPSSVVVATGAGSPPPTTASSGDRGDVAVEELRTQLSQLHTEAEAARSKADSARLRLLRLSEAAEKLRRQAILYIQKGKENEARDLLLQKKKVVEALDRSRTRIELLDRFSAKLNEAISLKETQLIRNLTLPLEVNKIDNDQPIHIIWPHHDIGESPGQNEYDGSSIVETSRTEDTEYHGSQANKCGEDLEHLDEPARLISSVDDDRSILRKMSSLNDFLEHIDDRLREIETEFVTLLKSASLELESDQKHKSPELLQASQILEDICRIRSRIASLIQRKT